MAEAMLSPDQTARQRWMGLLARAEPDALLAYWSAFDGAPEHQVLRAPEVGGVMLRGRGGGSGAPFNLGEMTVTRCSVTLTDGTVGHGYVQGRSKPAAEVAALVDALMQTSAAEAVEAAVLTPLADAENMRRSARAAKAAATKVEFFTMVRGED